MIRVGFNSHKGLKRENNEDSYFIMPAEKFFMVADGLGGYNGGQTASGIAVSKIAEIVKKNPIENHSGKDVISYLEGCVEAANIEIIHRGMRDEDVSGMATTIVLCHIDDKLGYFANAGDSRAYIYRNGKLKQITKDHSYVEDLMRAGTISREEAQNHRERHKITKALGVGFPVEADYYCESLCCNDIIILCSDGLHGEVEHKDICKIIEENKEMSSLAEALVDKANSEGGHDNITVICIKIERGFQ